MKEKKKPGRPPKNQPAEQPEKKVEPSPEPEVKVEPTPEPEVKAEPTPEPEVKAEPTPEPKKTVNSSPDNPVTKLVEDIEKYGNVDAWRLVCKASSKKEGWMKSTKAMDVGNGVLVQVSTQQGDKVAEALTYVEGVGVYESKHGGHRLVPHAKRHEPEE